MRVTHKLLYDSITYNLQRNQDSLYRTSEQLVAGKRIINLSDDPVGSARLVNLKKSVARIDQFESNNSVAESYLTATETAINQVNEKLNRVEELVLQQLSGVNTTEGQAAVAAEIQEIREATLQAANMKLDDRFIFSGWQTQSEAFNEDGSLNGGTNQTLEVEIADGAYIAMNLTGDEVFVDSSTGQTVVEFLDDVVALITAGDETGLRDSLTELSSFQDQALNAMSIVGARTNRLEMAQSDNDDLKISTESMISEIEDLDYIEASAKYAEQERVLEATMETASNMMSMSILDFLR